MSRESRKAYALLKLRRQAAVLNRRIDADRRRGKLPPHKALHVRVGNTVVFVWPSGWRLLAHPWNKLNRVTRRRVVEVQRA